MTLRTISDIFKAVADDIDEVKSYNFGWASDRTRSTNTEDFQELNEYPRVFFAVPTVPASNQIRKQDTYQVTVFVDDLLGYDNEGDADLTLQIDKWSDLQVIATKFIQRLNALKQTLLPDYIYIPEPPQMTFDSFVSMQRLVTVQLNFNIVVPTNCDVDIQKQILVFANLLGEATLQAGINIVVKVSSQMTGGATLTASALVSKLAASSLTGGATLTASALVSKLAASSLTGAGTLAAELTVTPAVTALLLDTYPNAAAAYSLRKLRTAYTGSAIRVRRSSDNTEQDIGFVNNVLDEAALTTFCGAGDGFVTTWYDQSGNGRNATQATAANQSRIVNAGVVEKLNSKPVINQVVNNAFKGYLTTYSNLLNRPVTIFGVYKTNILASNSFANVSFIIAGSSGVGGGGRYETAVDNTNIFVSQIRGLTPGCFQNLNPLTYVVQSSFFKTNTIQQRLNNIDSSEITPTGTIYNTASNFVIGATNVRADFNSAKVLQEFIIYENDLFSNRVAIETNINTHYAIY